MVPKLKAVSLCCWIFGAHKHCLVSWPSWKRGFNEHVITFRCSKGVVICGASAGTWCRTTLACPIKVISTKTLPRRWHRVYYQKKKCDRLRGSCRSEMTATVKITQAIFCLFSERRRELSAVYISKRKWVELDIKKMGVYRKKNNEWRPLCNLWHNWGQGPDSDWLLRVRWKLSKVTIESKNNLVGVNRTLL